MKEIRFGLIGKKMMGRAHSLALRNMNSFYTDLNIKPVLKTVCGSSPDGLQEMADQFGWEKVETDWHKVCADPEIDAVIIAVPGFLHRDICVEAAKHGKHVFTEKPIARSYHEALEMKAAIEENNVLGMVNFNYRMVPAVQLAKKIIQSGDLGEIVSYKGFYQNDWGLWGMPMCWKYSAEMDGEGPQQNGIHILDMSHFLLGEITDVVSTCRTIIPERPNSRGEMVPVTNDDDSIWLAKFENGIIGVFEATRAHAGHRNQQWFEVNGTKGAVRFELERLNELQVFSDKDGELSGWRTILVTEKEHPYVKYWWPAGHLLGWEHTGENQWYEFLKAVEGNYQPSPSFEEGAYAQRVLEAIVTSQKENRWVSVEEIQ